MAVRAGIGLPSNDRMDAQARHTRLAYGNIYSPCQILDRDVELVLTVRFFSALWSGNEREVRSVDISSSDHRGGDMGGRDHCQSGDETRDRKPGKCDSDTIASMAIGMRLCDFVWRV